MCVWGGGVNVLKAKMKIIHINDRSLLQKIEQLRVIASLGNVDILSVNETILDSTITNGGVNMCGYELYRK